MLKKRKYLHQLVSLLVVTPTYNMNSCFIVLLHSFKKKSAPIYVYFWSYIYSTGMFIFIFSFKIDIDIFDMKNVGLSTRLEF